jgi:hypothetical protein
MRPRKATAVAAATLFLPRAAHPPRPGASLDCDDLDQACAAGCRGGGRDAGRQHAARLRRGRNGSCDFDRSLAGLRSQMPRRHRVRRTELRDQMSGVGDLLSDSFAMPRFMAREATRIVRAGAT